MLVVGAGPVGMTAAILLASHGVQVTVVEKNASTADDPKAISLDDESLRVYQRAGVVDDILPVIVPGTGTRYFDSEGTTLFHGGAPTPFRMGHPFKNPFAQPDLERVLRTALESHPRVSLHFATELTGLDISGDSVSAQLRSGGEYVTVNPTYLLAADGGRSPVRTMLDITMTGTSHDDVWLVVDCLGDEHNERYGMHHADPRRPHVIVPGLDGRCRYEFYLYPGEGEATTNPPFELIERLMAPHRSITPEQVERAVSYRFHGLNADEWRRGPLFLLGDAAHMMPPFAGQGLNSGIRDAANLTWKVAAALRGDAGDDLLDTYQQERRPHAGAVIRSSERLGRLVMTTNPRLAKRRDAVIRSALERPEGRAFFEQMRYRPSTRISSGLVIDADREPLVGTALGQPQIFDLATHSCRLLDDVLGDGWAIIGVGLGADATPETWSELATAFEPLQPRLIDAPLDDRMDRRPGNVRVVIDLDTRLYAELGSARGRLVVVRPDRVIAAVVRPDEVHDVARRLTPGASHLNAVDAITR